MPPHTVMVHREDMTEARHAEHERETMVQTEKVRALGQMATGIDHDLNQSLMFETDAVAGTQSAKSAGVEVSSP